MTMKPTDLSKSLTDFLSKYLPGERGMSYNTISSYKVTFILFLTFMRDQKGITINKLTLKELTKDDIVAFLDWLQKVRNCSDATRNVRLAALHSFCRFLQYENPESLNEWQRILSISMKRTSKSSPCYLTTDGIKLLLRQPDAKTPKGLRDLAILCLMYDTAARVSEIISLTPSMIRLEKPYTIKLVGKGNKARIVPLMENNVTILRQYMTRCRLLENNANQKPLFYNARNEKLTRAGIHYILQCYANQARNRAAYLIPKKISCHSLRHSKAVHLLQAGVNLVYIRDILGHQSVKTTEIYARIDSKHKRDVLEKAYSDVGTNEIPIWEHNDNLLTWLEEFK
jgi:site-specific recombinase XerD